MIFDALNDLAAWLCQTIYPLIAYIYKLFSNIGTLRILEQDNIDPIYKRVTLILGLVMLFVVVFQLIQYIMEPDNFSDKEKGFGKVMLRMVISVSLIAITPTLFNIAFEVQDDIMNNHLIETLVLGSDNNYDENFGGQLSGTLLEQFYKVNPNLENAKCKNGLKASEIVNLNIGELKDNNRLGKSMDVCLNETVGEDRIIKFDGILAVLVGAVVLWMLAMYCLDLGVRVIQLTYLQVIAPIPIIMYMLPKKDGAFEKWVKQCLTTFLDLFIRTAIICFAILIISMLNSSVGSIGANVAEGSQGDSLLETLIYVCLVLGVMTFAKKAGDMLKELFPKGNAASGELGLSTKNRIPEPAKRVAGAGVGLVTAGALGMARRIAGNVKYNKQGKEEKAALKNRLENARKSYREAVADEAAAKNPAERNAARNRVEAYRKEMSDANSKLRDANWRYSKTRMVAGTISGTVSAANKGMVAGLTTKGGFGGVSKATQSVIKENRALEEWRENGGTSSVNRIISGINQGIGINPTEVYDRRKEKIEKENTALSKYSESFKKAKESIESDIEEGKCDGVNANAKNYRMEQIKAQRLTAQAGNLKLTDFKYKDSQEKDDAKTQIREMLTTPQQTYVSGDFTSRLTYRKNAKLLEIAEKIWDNDKDNNKNGTKFSNLKGNERENAITSMLNKLADSAYEEVNYESTVEEYEERAREAGNTANDYKKKATQEIGDAIMNGGYKDAAGNVIYKNDKVDQLFNIAKSAASDGNVDTEIFTDANLVTYANLKELNDKASEQQNLNTIDLYRMQQSPEYKAAQADKKYNEGGKK